MASTPSANAWDECLGTLLHFHQVLTSISGLCVTAEGQARVLALQPGSDLEQLQRQYSATEELLRLVEKKLPPPLNGFPDARPALRRLERGIQVLTPEDFHHLRQVLQLLGPLQSFFADQTDLTYWPELTQELDVWPAGLHEINRVVDEDQTIKSSASKELLRIRQAIRKLEEQVRDRLEALHNQARKAGWAQDEPIAWREGRLVIAMKATHKRKLRGLIHGHSSSGATAFVEPLEIFDLNNELAAQRDDEKAEELRLLTLLTEALRPYTMDLQQSIEVLYQLDACLAQAHWAAQLDAIRPRLGAEGPLELRGARNPILAAHREVVPLDIRLDDPERILLISGPNAGGKTVVLLTVGLFVMLAQSGLFLPARQADLPLFSSLFTDLGDRQSLEEDLSTFSAHLANLQSILSHCDARTLVLLDELGTGTDPEAGAALGQTFLEAIRARGALCLATTHLNRLKLWAQDEKGLLNAGMAFDSQELRPTYRLEIGRPGASFALEIARRMGLDEQLLQRAQNLIPESSANLEDLLLSLEEDRASIVQLKAELEAQLIDISDREKELARKESEIKAAHRRAHKDALREAEQLVSELNRRLETAVAEIRRKGAELSKEDIRQAKQVITREKRQLAEQQSQLVQEEPAPLSMDDLQPGTWVMLKEQSRLAQVEKRYPAKERVTVSVEGVRLTLPLVQLAPAGKPSRREADSSKSQAAGPRVSLTGQASFRLDLRGQRGDEAVAEVDRFLNHALLAGLNEVEIIHGKGTGALQKRVREYLQDHSQVKSFRFADFDAGGTGVTLVELR